MLWGGWGTTPRVCNDACCPFHLMGIFMQACICVCVCVYFWRQLKACGQFGRGNMIDADVLLCACICVCANEGVFGIAK